VQFITIYDYLLLPFYLLVIYLVAYRFRNKYYPEGHPWRPYFIPGLTVKIAGAIFIGMLYQYYYSGGDTANYFLQGRVVNSAFSDSPGVWLKLLLHIPNWYDHDYIQYTSQMPWYEQSNTYTIVAISAFLGVFSFNSFLVISVLFATISFTGIWALFRTFARQYPNLLRQIAVACIFIPSTFIWGSGIFKDTICMFALGWLTYGTFRLLIQRQFSLQNIALTLLSFYMVAIVKIYILVAFIPALALWILFSYSQKIQSGFVRNTIKVVILLATVGSMSLFAPQLSESLGSYSVENIAKTSTITREYVYGVSGDEGSGYNIGDVDPSLGGMVQKLPISVLTALFRPFLWEARKPIVLANALEAFLFLVITLKILLTVGPARIWKTISSDANIQFFLIFTLIFAFGVGLSSGNFGTLSRYRIPCLPFYAMAVVLIYYKNANEDKRLLGNII